LKENGIVPILRVLRDINRTSDFTRYFKHLSPKHHKLKPNVETVLAGIMGMGCNIGIDKLSQISVGINESTLKNTVNWCFSLKNIQAANNVIIGQIDKLALSNAFQKYPDQLHTSSDGRKVNVGVDSLHASYSFKYFGKDKGVTMYTFIDERHALFHSTVISASDREAAYVIDGLMQNEVVKSDIHSTDTHGFSEAIFTATHMIDTAFAPRFKKIGEQRLYGFSSKSTYQRRGYSIVPSRTINRKLILKNWDDILRFMATIKLRYSSASQLFKRLSSYAKDHPLYRALKEFGRIIKSQFILTYYDDVVNRPGFLGDRFV
jgi:TnpA family transposase